MDNYKYKNNLYSNTCLLNNHRNYVIVQLYVFYDCIHTYI